MNVYAILGCVIIIENASLDSKVFLQQQCCEFVLWRNPGPERLICPLGCSKTLVAYDAVHGVESVRCVVVLLITESGFSSGVEQTDKAGDAVITGKAVGSIPTSYAAFSHKTPPSPIA